MSEDKVQSKSITEIACSSLGGQAFHANALAFPSHAQFILNHYIWVAIALTADLPMEGIVPVALMTQDWVLEKMTAASVARASPLDDQG